MKWFKCDADLLDSPKIQALIAEHGFEGLGRWIAILTIVAKRMDSTDKCSVTYPLKTWAKLLSSRTGVLQEFVSSLIRVELLSDSCRIESDSSLTIHIPNLLKKRDEYSEKSRHAPKNIPSKSKDIRDKSKDTENTPKGVLVTAASEFADILLKWNLLCAEINSIPKITAITGKRRTAIKARLSDKGFDFDKLIEAIREQPFLHGQNDRNWIVKFDWAIAETNWPKIIERNYANSRPSISRKQNTTRQLDPEFAKQLAEREKRKIVL